MFEFAKKQYEDLFGQKVSEKYWKEILTLYVDSNLNWDMFLRLEMLCPKVLLMIIAKNRMLYDLKEKIYEIYKNESNPAEVTKIASEAIDRIVNHFYCEDERRRTADNYFNDDLKDINETKDVWGL